MTKRAYVSDEVHARIDKYAAANGLKTQEEAYDAVVRSAIDENGDQRTLLSLTEPQRKTINDIADELGQTPEKTAQDLINFSMLVYGTSVSLREVIIFSGPLFMNSLIESHPEIAKEILKGLKQTPVKLSPQAALRYE